MQLLNKLFKEKETEVVRVVIPPTKGFVNLPKGQIVSFEKEFLDTTLPENIAIFKHNLEILIEKAKSKGYIDKFMLIRQDDCFPLDNKWRASCSFTSIEKANLGLSYAIKKQLALERTGIQLAVDGLEPLIEPKTMAKALSSVDNKTAFVYMPPIFHSTKHFTINTPLEITGLYNAAKNDKTFTIIDSLDNFLNSGYGYSISYYDAYLDVSHEALDISSEAIILIKKSKYDELAAQTELMKQLANKKIVIYEDDESLAIDMILTELGVLPSEVGTLYAEYDDELKKIINDSLKKLAHQNNLLYNQSHYVYMHPEKGHFSSYFDEYNIDYISYLAKFINFMRYKFPKYSDLFTDSFVNNSSEAMKLVDKIGIDALRNAINEYNDIALIEFQKRNKSYIIDHDNISEERQNIIKQTLKLISKDYKIDMEFDDAKQKALLEEAIRRFFQLPTVKEQVEAAKIIWKILEPQLSKIESLNNDNLVL